jgi:hypothetical protein
MGSSHERVEGGSGGVMRRLAAGSKGSGFANAFQFVDALFSPSKTASYAERQEARRRKVAVPAPGDPPAEDEDPFDGYGPPDDAAAIPRFLLRPVDPADEPPSARGEHHDSDME